MLSFVSLDRTLVEPFKAPFNEPFIVQWFSFRTPTNSKWSPISKLLGSQHTNIGFYSGGAFPGPQRQPREADLTEATSKVPCVLAAHKPVAGPATRLHPKNAMAAMGV